MPPKKAIHFEGQGAFLTEQPSGVTDPALKTATGVFDVVPDGVYPEAITAPEPVASLEFTIPEAVKTVNRHKAQVGKHSPLQRDGSYQHIQVGDYLPGGFGPVTHRNFEDARQYAEQLEANR